MYSVQPFLEATRKFHNKEMSVKDYKGFSGLYGSYAQRGAQKHMLRLRFTGGCISRDQLRFVADVVKKYHIDRIHTTTCQTIQLHNLSDSAVCEILQQTQEHGIYTIGGGGDHPRNVMASPLSGVDREEYFDVLPYAKEAANYLLGLIGQIKMPRKLKVGFSSSPKNECHVTFRDLGFMARPDGKFDVYSAGGLGNNPKLGVVTARGIDPADVLYYIRAMVDTFMAYGNYENRAKARTRYMQDSLGDQYLPAFFEKLDILKKSKALRISPVEQPPTKAADPCYVDHPRIRAQKQANLYYVSYHPLGGNLSPEKVISLSSLLDGMESTQLRLSPEGTVYIVNCSGEEAKKIVAETDDGARTIVEASTACIGSSICQIGLRDSQALLKEILQAAAKKNYPDGTLPQLHISGCTSSCGAHQSALIGFQGAVKRTEEGVTPAFTMYLNGCEAAGNERLGEPVGTIAQSDIPSMLMEIGDAAAVAGCVFSDWIKSHRDVFDTIVERYL